MIFFIIATFILALVYLYIGLRIIVPAKLTNLWKNISWSTLILFLIMPPSSIIFVVYGYETFWTKIFSWVSFISLGFFNLVFTFLIISDLIKIIVRGIKKSFTFLQGFISFSKNFQLGKV